MLLVLPSFFSNILVRPMLSSIHLSRRRIILSITCILLSITFYYSIILPLIINLIMVLDMKLSALFASSSFASLGLVNVTLGRLTPSHVSRNLNNRSALRQSKRGRHPLSLASLESKGISLIKNLGVHWPAPEVPVFARWTFAHDHDLTVGATSAAYSEVSALIAPERTRFRTSGKGQDEGPSFPSTMKNTLKPEGIELVHLPTLPQHVKRSLAVGEIASYNAAKKLTPMLWF